MTKDEIIFKLLGENFELKEALQDKTEEANRWWERFQAKEEECARLRLPKEPEVLTSVIGDHKE